MRLPNIISGIIMVCVGVFFLVNSMNFPTLPTEDVGAAFMPRVYSVLIIVLGLSLAIKAFIEKSTSEEKTEGYIIFVLIAMLILTIYIVLIPLIGMYIATLIFTFSFLLFAKVRRKIILISIPIGAILFIYLLFDKVLKVSIPVGLLFS